MPANRMYAGSNWCVALDAMRMGSSAEVLLMLCDAWASVGRIPARIQTPL